MTLELVKRWNGVSSEQNALLEPSTFGLHEARQDYRGFQWRKEKVGRRLVQGRNTAAHIDLSDAHIEEWMAIDITLEDVVCHNATLPRLKFSDSALTDCHFAKCDMSSNIQSIFGKCTILHSTIDSCTGTNQWLAGAKRIADSSLLNLTIADIGVPEPNDAPLITNTTITGTIKNCVIAQTKGEQQLLDTDISGATLKDVAFPGVNMDSVTYAEELSPFILPDWQRHEVQLSDAANAAKHSCDRNIHIAALTLLSILKREKESSYWIKDRWPRGSRFLYELHPTNQLDRVRPGIIQIYDDAGLLPESF